MVWEPFAAKVPVTKGLTNYYDIVIPFRSNFTHDGHKTAAYLPTSYIYTCISYISCHIVDIKWQNCLKVGTDKPKLKVTMQSVSDDVWKRCLEEPRFELAAKGVFRLGRCYIFQQCAPGFWSSNRKSMATDGWSLDRRHQKTLLSNVYNAYATFCKSTWFILYIQLHSMYLSCLSPYLCDNILSIQRPWRPPAARMPQHLTAAQ